jgi:hypothetical protein
MLRFPPIRDALIRGSRPTFGFDRSLRRAPLAPAPGRSRSRPKGDIVRCGERSTRSRAAAHGAPAPQAHTRSRSACIGTAGRSRATQGNGTARWAGQAARSGSALRPTVRPPANRSLLARPGGRRPGALPLPHDPCKGSGQVAQQTIEWACQDHRPRNENIVVARHTGAGEDLAGGLRKAAARPIASDGVADSSAGGEAQADLRALPRRRPGPDLENESRRNPTTPGGCDGKELVTPLETRYRNIRLALVTQTDARATSPRLAAQPLATLGTPAGEHPAAANSCHARAKAVPPLANDIARLIGALHAGPLAKPRPNRSAV